MRELLRTYDELLVHRLAETEARVRLHLSAEAEMNFGVLRRLMTLVAFAADALDAFITDVVSRGGYARVREYYGGVFDEIDRETEDVVQAAQVARRKLEEVPAPRPETEEGGPSE